MHFEIKLSIDVFSSTTIQGSARPQVINAPNHYHQYLAIVTAVASIVAIASLVLYLHLIWLHIQRLIPKTPADEAPTFTENLRASRGPNTAACQCRAPPQTQIDQATTLSDEEAPTPRPSKDRLPIAQAPGPSDQLDGAHGGNQPLPPSFSAPVAGKTARGLSPPVVRPPDSVNSSPHAPGQDGAVPEKPVHSTRLPTRLSIGNTSAAANSVGSTSHGNSQAQSSPAQIPNSVAEGSSGFPLKKTLVDRDIPLGTPFVALGVGVSNKGLPGPHHDIDLIGTLLPKDAFRALKGSDATREVVRQEIQGMFESAQPPTAIVLYFTGHGDDCNAFQLYDGQSIGVDVVLEWIDEARNSTHKRLPVVLVFDHCRETTDLPLMAIEKLELVYIIWACSPHQRAYEVNIDENLPYSEFLKTVFLTLRELLLQHPQAPSFFLERAVYWMGLTTRVHCGFICERAKCPIPWRTV
ncbi:hypothetical protein FRC07_007214 [Ceratobasidium sp. 392]|nr:hypothetical protein FRC07_007214 [Ceratobasidium sp. 392]